jgi:hypothetical protein
MMIVIPESDMHTRKAQDAESETAAAGTLRPVRTLYRLYIDSLVLTT